MKSKISIIILVLGCGSLGYLTGNSVGRADEYDANTQRQRTKGIDQLRWELKQIEQLNLLQLLKISAEVKQTDEGGLFKTKYVYHLHGRITNNAAVAEVKDVKLKIEFFSKTEASISSAELTLYEFIQPHQVYSFKEKINWPSNAETFRLSIVDAKIN